jgi:uncharacterized protein with von Willebrand factor type A (vWA) domain
MRFSNFGLRKVKGAERKNLLQFRGRNLKNPNFDIKVMPKQVATKVGGTVLELLRITPQKCRTEIVLLKCRSASSSEARLIMLSM